MCALIKLTGGRASGKEQVADLVITFHIFTFQDRSKSWDMLSN